MSYDDMAAEAGPPRRQGWVTAVAREICRVRDLARAAKSCKGKIIRRIEVDDNQLRMTFDDCVLVLEPPSARSLGHDAELLRASLHEAVIAAERRGGGPQALAMVMLIGKEPVNFGTAVWACEPSYFFSTPAPTVLYWGSAQRAALAYCLTHNIPLDYPTSAGAIAPPSHSGGLAPATPPPARRRRALTP